MPDRTLNERIGTMLESAEKQVGDLKNSWETLSKASRNEPIGGQLDVMGGEFQRCMPLIQPRVNQLVAYVCGPMFAVMPYFAARPTGSGGGRSEDVENGVQFMMSVASAPRVARKAIRTSAIAEPALITAYFEDGEDNGMPPRICLDVVHPTDTRIYPVHAESVCDAQLVGVRKYLSVGTIREMYNKNVQPEGADPLQDNQARSADYSGVLEGQFAAKADDELVEVFEGLLKEDKKWRRIVFAKHERIILLNEEYAATSMVSKIGVDDLGETYETIEEAKVPYSRPWYFEQRLQEKEQSEFYHASPFARPALDLARSYNDFWGLLTAGTAMGAFGAGFTSARLPKQVINFKPGELWQLDGPIDIQWAHVSFDGANIPGILAKLENMTDSALRISQLGISQQMKSGTTATEAAALTQAQTAGTDEYREMAGNVWLELADWFRELIYIHWDRIIGYWGDSFPARDREAFSRPCIWDLVGKSDEMNPKVLIDKVGILTQYAPLFGWNVGAVGDAMLDALNLPIDKEKLKNVNPQLPGVDAAGSGMGLVQGVPEGMPEGPDANNAGY